MELARPRDGFGATVRPELRVYVAEVGPYGVGRHEQLRCDLGRLDVRGEVPSDAQLRFAQLVHWRLVIAATARRPAAEDVQDLRDECGVCCAVPRVLAQQVLDGRGCERQDQAFQFG